MIKLTKKQIKERYQEFIKNPDLNKEQIKAFHTDIGLKQFGPIQRKKIRDAIKFRGLSEQDRARAKEKEKLEKLWYKEQWEQQRRAVASLLKEASQPLSTAPWEPNLNERRVYENPNPQHLDIPVIPRIKPKDNLTIEEYFQSELGGQEPKYYKIPGVKNPNSLKTVVNKKDKTEAEKKREAQVKKIKSINKAMNKGINTPATTVKSPRSKEEVEADKYKAMAKYLKKKNPNLAKHYAEKAGIQLKPAQGENLKGKIGAGGRELGLQARLRKSITEEKDGKKTYGGKSYSELDSKEITWHGKTGKWITYKGKHLFIPKE